MIFSFPENEQLLFGCEASDSKESVYTCAVSEKAVLTNEEKNTLLKVIDSDTVNRVILVVSDTSHSQLILEDMRYFPGPSSTPRNTSPLLHLESLQNILPLYLHD